VYGVFIEDHTDGLTTSTKGVAAMSATVSGPAAPRISVLPSGVALATI